MNPKSSMILPLRGPRSLQLGYFLAVPSYKKRENTLAGGCLVVELRLDSELGAKAPV